MIDLSATHLATVKRILAEHVPTREVRAFGSRVKGTAKPYSDLDIAVLGEQALSIKQLGELREAFEVSDLPIRVDVADWNAISTEFQKVIAAHYEVLQAADTQG